MRKTGAVLQNEGRVLPAELTAEIIVKVLLLSLRCRSDMGDAAFLPACPLGGHGLPRVNFDLRVRRGFAPISAFAPLVEIWQAFLIMVSLSV